MSVCVSEGRCARGCVQGRAWMCAFECASESTLEVCVHNPPHISGVAHTRCCTRTSSRPAKDHVSPSRLVSPKGVYETRRTNHPVMRYSQVADIIRTASRMGSSAVVIR